MTLSKAIDYLDYLLKQHPRIEHADFGNAIKLGREALQRIEVGRNNPGTHWTDPLPGEDPE